MRKFFTWATLPMLPVLFVVGCVLNQKVPDVQPPPAPVGDVSPHTSAPTPTPTPTAAEPPSQVKPVETPAPTAAVLSWESGGDLKRKAWSYALLEYIADTKAKFDKASDIESFCPKYKKLDELAQSRAISEIIIAVMTGQQIKN